MGASLCWWLWGVTPSRPVCGEPWRSQGPFPHWGLGPVPCVFSSPCVQWPSESGSGSRCVQPS